MGSFVRNLARIWARSSEDGQGRDVAKASEKNARQAADSAAYWTAHNVTAHFQFSSAEESLEYFNWRNDQYFNYLNIMPVKGQDGLSVLDFGCGPGHDLVGFGVYSKPSRLVGVDVSSSSLAEAKRRMALHRLDAELVEMNDHDVRLPFEDQSFDYIHSSGVLHHTPDPGAILCEFRRILKPGGAARVMVYNYYSLWVHLYVAYQRALVDGLHTNCNPEEQFRRSTDGDDCPISVCYRPEEWLELGECAGLRSVFLGAAVSMHEMSLLPIRFAAIQDRRLPQVNRTFLLSLLFDAAGYPMFNGHYAGIDGCFLMERREGK